MLLLCAGKDDSAFTADDLSEAREMGDKANTELYAKVGKLGDVLQAFTDADMRPAAALEGDVVFDCKQVRSYD